MDRKTVMQIWLGMMNECDQFFLGSSFLAFLVKGSGSLSGSGGIINLGSAQRYFLLSQFLLAYFFPFIIYILMFPFIIYILMNKQAYYVPNFNSLHNQNRDYLHHQQRLKESKSQYQIYSSCDPIPKDGFVAVKQQLFVKMVPGKYSASRDAYQSAEGDLLRVNKSYRMELTPLQKRKYSEQTRQNQRIYKAMHILSPRIERYDRSREQSQIALKERISKFIKDGSKISYKFKKSLIEVQKRKKEKDDYYSQRSNMIREDARVQLQSIIQKSIRLQKSKSKDLIDGGIYVEDNDMGQKKNSLQKLSIEEIISKVKTIKKEEEQQRLKTEQQSTPKKVHFLKNHRQLINKKIVSFHLQNIKEKKQQPTRRQDLLKKLNSNHSQHFIDNKLGTHSKPKRVLDIQIVEVSPVSYGN